MSGPATWDLRQGFWYLVSCAPESWELALEDLKSIDPGARLAETFGPGMLLVRCEWDPAALAARLRTSGPFVRHLFRVLVAVPVRNQLDDLMPIQEAATSLAPSLTPAAPLSVQTRILKPAAYRNYDVNTAVARALTDEGFSVDVRRPAQVVSVVVTDGAALIGAGPVEHNLSDWAGGARRYQHQGSVSRSEFKLMEALEVFRLDPPPSGTGLDLGAAPGGWTRVLRSRGLRVVAVDPAALDPGVLADGGVTHVRRTAESYLADGGGSGFDIVVNDMKMDAGPSAAIMCRAASTLGRPGIGVMTAKLHARRQRRQVTEVLSRLQEAYAIGGVRKLYHNRDEVTVALERLG